MECRFEKADGTIVAVMTPAGRLAVSPLDLDKGKDFVAISEAYAATLAPPVDAMMREFEALKGNAALMDKFVDRAYRDVRESSKGTLPPRDDVIRWMDTPEGMIFSWWIQLKKASPAIGIAEVEDYIWSAIATEIKDTKDKHVDRNKAMQDARDLANPAAVRIKKAKESGRITDDATRLDELKAAGVSIDRPIVQS